MSMGEKGLEISACRMREHVHWIYEAKSYDFGDVVVCGNMSTVSNIFHFCRIDFLN
jgi:hypothetical protein